MKIGIIADTHGNFEGWRRAWEFLHDSDVIFHCGDTSRAALPLGNVERKSPRVARLVLVEGHLSTVGHLPVNEA